MSSSHDPSGEHAGGGTGFGAWWHRTPLYLRILGALLVGVVVGFLIRSQAGAEAETIARALEEPSKLILRLLGALAPPLILVAIVHALMTADFRGGSAGRLARLLLLNTVVAIVVGLAVANLIQPGKQTLSSRRSISLRSPSRLPSRTRSARSRSWRNTASNRVRRRRKTPSPSSSITSRIACCGRSSRRTRSLA